MRKYSLPVLLFILFSLTAACSSSLGLTVTFDRVEGLKEGDRVVFDGNQVGQVKEIRYTPQGRFEVDLEIKDSFKALATDKTSFVVVADPSLASHRAVELLRATEEGKPLAQGSKVEGATRLGAVGEDLKRQMEGLFKGLADIPQEKWYQDLMAQLEQYIKAMENSSQEAKDKFKEEILPQLEKSIKEFEAWLKKQGRDDEAEKLEEKRVRLERT